MGYVSRDLVTQSTLKRNPVARVIVNKIHGSGINFDWRAKESAQNIRLINAFHTMDEYGGYDQIVDFVIVIPKKKPLDFKLQFQGRKGQYYAKKYMLRDYLEGMIYEEIYNYLKKTKRR